MRCLYCGNELALLKKLTGGGEFCSEAHRQKYQEEYNRLALGRLLQAQNVTGERPPLETQAARKARQAESPRLSPQTVVEEVVAHEAPVQAAPPKEAPAPSVAVEEIEETRLPEADPAVPADPAEAGFVLDLFNPSGPFGDPVLSEPVFTPGTAVMPPQQSEQVLEAQLAEPGAVALPNLQTGWKCAVRTVEKSVDPREFTRSAPFVRIPLENVRPKRLGPEGESAVVLLEAQAPADASPWQFDPADFAILPACFVINAESFAEAVHERADSASEAELNLRPFSDVPEGVPFEAAALEDEPPARRAPSRTATPKTAPPPVSKAVSQAVAKAVDEAMAAPAAPAPAAVERVSAQPLAVDPAALKSRGPVAPPLRPPAAASKPESAPPPVVVEKTTAVASQSPVKSAEPAFVAPKFAASEPPKAIPPAPAPVAPTAEAVKPAQPRPTVVIDLSMFGDFDDEPAPPKKAAAPVVEKRNPEPVQVKTPPVVITPPAPTPAPVPAAAPPAPAPAAESGSKAKAKAVVTPPAEPVSAKPPVHAEPKVPKAAERRLEIELTIAAPKSGRLSEMNAAAPPPGFRISPPVLESVAVRPKMVFGQRPDTKAAPKTEVPAAKSEAAAPVERTPEPPKQVAAPLSRRDQRRNAPQVKPVRPGLPKPAPEAEAPKPVEVKAPQPVESKIPEPPARPEPARPAAAAKSEVERPPVKQPETPVEKPRQKPETHRSYSTSLDLDGLHLGEDHEEIGSPIGSAWAHMTTQKKIAVGVGLALALVVGGSFLKSAVASKGSAPVINAASVDAVGPSLVSGAGGWSSDWAGLGAKHQISYLRSSSSLADYRIVFQGQIENKSISWVFRAMNPKNYYGTRLEMVKPGLQPRVMLVHYAVIDGEEAGRTEMPLPFPVHIDTVYKVRTDVYGTHFKTYLQDQLVDSWSDDRLKTGGFGLVSERTDRAQVRLVQLYELRAGH